MSPVVSHVGLILKYSQNVVSTKNLMVSYYGNQYLFPDIACISIFVFAIFIFVF